MSHAESKPHLSLRSRSCSFSLRSSVKSLTMINSSTSGYFWYMMASFSLQIQTVRKPSSLAPLKMFRELCEPKVPMASFGLVIFFDDFADFCAANHVTTSASLMFSERPFNFHSNSFAWTYFYAVLVFHVGRGWFNAGAAWNTGANVEDSEF